MDLCQMIDICISCIGYTIRQVETSDIDIMGLRAAGYDDVDAKKLHLKMLAEVYSQFDNLTYTNPYYGLTRQRLDELLTTYGGD